MLHREGASGVVNTVAWKPREVHSRQPLASVSLRTRVKPGLQLADVTTLPPRLGQAGAETGRWGSCTCCPHTDCVEEGPTHTPAMPGAGGPPRGSAITQEVCVPCCSQAFPEHSARGRWLRNGCRQRSRLQLQCWSPLPPQHLPATPESLSHEASCRPGKHSPAGRCGQSPPCPSVLPPPTTRAARGSAPHG